MKTIACLLDGSRGIYLPQNFIQIFPAQWHIKPEDKAILEAGPDHGDYWETWDDVLQYAYFEEDGFKWSLLQDGDLFAVREDHVFEHEGAIS